MQHQTLIITGMHRSGTSLITNWLQKCGLQIGEELLGPGKGNAEGHFEDVDFCNVHEEILRQNNLDGTGIITTANYRVSDGSKEKVKEIATVKNNKFVQWGWKDPRTCLFLNLYREILPNACYLVIARNYREVVISLLKRTMLDLDEVYRTQKGCFSRLAWNTYRRKRFFNRFCREHAAFYLQVWINYNQQILQHIKALPADKYLVVNYNNLITSDQEVISFLNNDWHFNLQPVSFSSIFKKGMFSKNFDVEQYIDDKILISVARDLDAQLQSAAQVNPYHSLAS